MRMFIGLLALAAGITAVIAGVTGNSSRLFTTITGKQPKSSNLPDLSTGTVGGQSGVTGGFSIVPATSGSSAGTTGTAPSFSNPAQLVQV